MKSKAFLEEVRVAQGLPRAVLKKIEVEGDKAVFHLVTDTNYTQEDVAYASGVAAKYVPAGMRAEARVLKSVPSEEGVRQTVLDVLRRRFPAFAAFLSPADVAVALDGKGGRFFLEAGETEGSRADADGVLDVLAEELGRNYCGVWIGEIRTSKRERGEIERDALPPEEPIFAPRTFEVCGYSAIDGANAARAIYIADLTKEMQGIAVCGKISFIAERVTKSGKPYFSLSIADGTATARVSYFPKKASVEKVRALAAGMSVVVTGDNELYNGAFSVRAHTVDLGSPPEGFVPVSRPSRPVPAQYRTVFPVPESDFVQGDLFGGKPLGEEFTKQSFVVFDLETTGLGLGGAMDRIIELGAVKIENGRISERFSSFVACPVKLSEEIVGLTGITDEMLVGAPPVEDVVADFFKFTAGCSLVAHNAPFDCRFLRYYGEQAGYLFEQREYDTVALAQKYLRLKNYKLDTVAEHYGFTFRHHRAFDDAFVTAKIFIELVREYGLE